MAEIDGLLKLMTDRGASDLHIKVGSPPVVSPPFAARGRGRDSAADRRADPPAGVRHDGRAASASSSNRAVEVDFAYQLEAVGRFRVNVFKQRGNVGMTLRRVATERSSIEALGLPPVIRAPRR